jgi:hypothetical protein
MRGLTLIQQLRFALAPSAARRDLFKNAALIAGLLIAFGIVGRMDYEDALRAEAEAALDQSALHQAALLACLNGGSPGLFTIDANGHRHYLVCGEPFTVSSENTKG